MKNGEKSDLTFYVSLEEVAELSTIGVEKILYQNYWKICQRTREFDVRWVNKMKTILLKFSGPLQAWGLVHILKPDIQISILQKAQSLV